MSKIKAVLFDLDGTLRDTREVIYPAIQHALVTHTGKSPTREQMKKQIHHHSEIHKEFAPDIPHDVFEATYKERVGLLRDKTVVYEGVIQLLESLKQQGYKLGIVSSAYSAGEYLKSIDALHFFDAIVGGPDTKEHKPHPDPVLLALQRMGTSPQETVLIGDLSVDIEAAKNAGLKATIGITHGFGTREELSDAGCDSIIDSLLAVESALKSIEYDT